VGDLTTLSSDDSGDFFEERNEIRKKVIGYDDFAWFDLKNMFVGGDKTSFGGNDTG